MQSLHPVKRECKFILPKPFSCDYGCYDASEFKVGDQVESIFGIKDEVQLDLDSDLIPTPNPPTAENKTPLKVVTTATRTRGCAREIILWKSDRNHIGTHPNLP